MRSVLKKIKPSFCDFDVNGVMRQNSYYRYFEEARFFVADYLKIEECLPKKNENEIFRFPVIKIQCNNYRTIEINKNDIVMKTTLLVPDGPKLEFEQCFYNYGELAVKALVSIAIVSDISGIVYTYSDDMKERITEFICGDDLIWE